MSLNYYNLQLYDLALFHVNKALSFDSNERLINNKKIIEKLV